MAIAQKNQVKGIVRDTAQKKNLQYAIVALIDQADSTLYTSTRSNESGEFELNKVPAGKYILLISYLRMADYLHAIVITDTSRVNLGKIDMVSRATLMQEVIVRSGQPIRMRGDTLEYTADSFAVRPGANVQELLKRLPGIQVDRFGKIIAQGKEVRKILVDGDEFFADDPKMVTQFLGADAVDKVQVFDKKSEATDFTGIDDGSRTKTINLQLKKNKKNGAFGKASAGTNADQYYDHQAMASLFRDSKKISVFGLASKTGKEGISYNDLGNYVAQDYERIEDGSNSYTSNFEYENENYYGSGIPSIKSGGAHFSNKWLGGRRKLFTNYRIKQIDAAGWSNSSGTSLLPGGGSFYNKSNNTENSSTFNQKASANFTTPIDSFTTLKISVNGNAGKSKRNNSGNSLSQNGKGITVNNSINSNKTESDNRRFASNISFQHKFKKEGRTISLQAQQDLGEGNSDDINYAENRYFDSAAGTFTKADTLNQLQKTHGSNRTYAAKISGTEKLSKEFRLSAEYGWKTVASQNKFKTYNGENGQFTKLLDTLSNDYDFTINTHITGASISWSRKKINITAGSKVYLTGFKQVNNDTKLVNRRNFTNIAPQAIVNITLQENTTISFNYSGETFQPSVEQLQPLRKSSNPLYVQLGNPDLLPGFNHNISANYNRYAWVKGRSFGAYLYASFAENAVTTKSTVDAQNRTTMQYINLRGVPQVSGSLNYSWQYKKLHLRPAIGLNAGLSGNNYILNGSTIQNKNLNWSLNPTLNYELENKLTVGYSSNINFTRARSSLAGSVNRNTITHAHTLSTVVYLPKKFELSSDCVFNFQPANSSFNRSFNTVKWNAALEKKFLKNDRGFARFSVNDLLNNNIGYSRSVDGTNIYEYNSLTIKRYFLFTVGWNFLKSIQ